MRLFLLPLALFSLPLGRPGQPESSVPSCRGTWERLTAPEMGARQVGTEGADAAAAYLASELEELGVLSRRRRRASSSGSPRPGFTTRDVPKLALVRESGERMELVHGRDFAIFYRGEPTPAPNAPFVRITSLEELPSEIDPSSALFFRIATMVRMQAMKALDIEGGVGFALEVEAGKEKRGKARGIPEPRFMLASEPEGCERVTLRG